MPPLRILGIDPGLEATGYGIIEANGQGSKLVEAGILYAKPDLPLPQRLANVSKELEAILTQFRPDLMVVEDLYSLYRTPKPAILMGHVRGVVLGQAALKGIPVVSYLPTRVKKSIVGRGHASKEQLSRMVQMRLNMASGPIPPDVSDALAVALCHADSLRPKGPFPLGHSLARAPSSRRGRDTYRVPRIS